MDLVIVGTIGLDDVKTPFGKVRGVLGGAGVYASAAASYFSKPGLISIKGKDLPDEKLAICGADLKGVKSDGKTFRWSGSYEFDMNEAKTLKTELNSLAGFEPKVPAEYQEAKFLLLGNIDPNIQLKIINQMKSHPSSAKATDGRPFIMLDTMNYWIDNQKEKLLEVIKKSDFIVMNEGEARQLTGHTNLVKAGRELIALGPKYVAIKKGEHGALLSSDGYFFSAPSYPLEELVDPTGAGDSFAGGTIGYLAKTGDLSEPNIRKAIIYGSAVASFCAESFSLDYKKKISLKDIEERYEIFRKIRAF